MNITVLDSYKLTLSSFHSIHPNRQALAQHAKTECVRLSVGAWLLRDYARSQPAPTRLQGDIARGISSVWDSE